MERLEQEQWQTTIARLQEARNQAAQEHARIMDQIKQKTDNAKAGPSASALEWLNAQLANAPKNPSEEDKAQQEKDKKIQDLKEQQEALSRQLAELQGHKKEESDAWTQLKDSLPGDTPKASQEVLLQQLKDTLAGKKEEDPNKTLLRALVTSQNKMAGEGGTNTLKPAVLNSLLTAEGGTSIAQWLTSLNRQEEGEFELSKNYPLGEGKPKPGKIRSGMLDKATTNIQVKQIWPQQNLGEDWADEDLDFKQVKFEHMVAGETRTIETCTDPAQILGQGLTINHHKHNTRKWVTRGQGGNNRNSQPLRQYRGQDRHKDR